MTTKTKADLQAADIAALLRARNPLLWIVTREEARVEGYLMEAAAAASYQCRTWDVAQGVCDMTGKPMAGVPGPDPGEVLATIRDRAIAGRERSVWILRDLPPWLQGSIGITTIRMMRNVTRMLPTVKRDSAQAIIVLSPDGNVPPELSNSATVIEWPLPDRDEIARILDAAIAGLPDNIRETAAPNGSRDAAVDAAVGLSGEEAAACYAKSLVQLRRIDPAAVSQEKRRVVARERVLEWYDPIPGGLDAVGGLENLKAWLVSRRSAYSPAAREYGLPAPKGCMLVGIPGCLHGDTPIYDPIADQSLTVAERYRLGRPFNVWSITDAGPVIATAMPPKRYGKEPMIKFGFSNGQSITVTEGHRFVSDGREISADEVFDRHLLSEPCLLQTSLAPALEARAADGRRSTQIAQDRLDRCLRGLSPDGEQPQSAEDTGLASSPSPDGVPAHTRHCSVADAPASGSGHSRPYQSSAHPSMLDYPDQNIGPSKTAPPVSVRSSGKALPIPSPETCQALALSDAGPTQTDTSGPLPDGANPSMPDVFSSTWYTSVRTARPIKAQPYYDFHVPGYENYWACGVWHHNCGKSLTAKAIATAWGVPLLKLDLGSLKSKFVGESESNLRRALKVIEAIGRSVVWLDEIEKALAGATQGAADGGVSSDALGTVLNWMQERAGQAFVIATANDVTQLPPELMRKGRFDELWFVDLPNHQERIAITQAALKANGRGGLIGQFTADWDAIADATAEFTGSEIASLVPDAMFAGFAEAKREITPADLIRAARLVVPMSRTSAEKIAVLRDWGRTRARYATPIDLAVAGAAPSRQLDF